MLSTVKVVVLGEGRVGKTSLMLRYTKDTFSDSQEPTVSASYVEKRVNLDGKPCKVNVWDTAGQERFHALGPLYYRDADAALVVFDVTDQGTLDKAKLWVKELRAMVEDRIPIALAGNKSDLQHDRVVSEEQAEAVARETGAALFWTSALANRNVDQVFVHLVRQALAREQDKLLKRQAAGAATTSNSASHSSGAGPLILEGVPARPSGGASSDDSGGCC